MMILLVGLEMLVELIDLLCQHSDLDRSGTGIFRVCLETVNDLCFLFFNYSQLTSPSGSRRFGPLGQAGLG